VKLKNYLNENANLVGENRFLKSVLLAVVISNILFGFLAYRAVKFRATVIVPFGLNEKVTVGERVVDEKYLLYMAKALFDLALNYTPATVEKQYELILGIMSPNAYPRYKARFLKFVKEAEMVKLVSVFLPDSIKHDPGRKAIMATGTRMLLLEGEQVVESKRTTYELRYSFSAGQFHIEDFGEKGKLGKVLGASIKGETK